MQFVPGFGSGPEPGSALKIFSVPCRTGAIFFRVTGLHNNFKVCSGDTCITKIIMQSLRRSEHHMGPLYVMDSI